MDSSDTLPQSRNFLSLPAEIRIQILELVFDKTAAAELVRNVYLNKDSSVAHRLQPLLTCKQFHQDASLLAFTRTHFVVTNLFLDIPQRISTLHPKQIECIRSITFVADARHLRKLHTWNNHAFGLPSLQLDNLTIVLRRSSSWHYLFDFTTDIVRLLRNLQGVKRLTIVRNGALVKGSFKTWYNRLVGLILKIDHSERYDKTPPNPETTWWQWNYDEAAQIMSLQARNPKPLVDEEEYMQQILPFMEDLRVSMENEEYNPDPRSRLPYY